MHIRLRRTLILSVSALALLGAPVLLQGLPFIPDGVAIAGNGNGNGGGNGGGSDNGNSGGGGSDNGNSGGDHGNSGNSDRGSGNGGGNGSRSGDSATVSATENGNGRSKRSAAGTDTTTSEDRSNSKRSLNAELGGLNSLNRNINGLMNSSDPRMDDIRDFIVASAALEDAQDALDDATAQLAKAEDAYRDALQSAGIEPSLSVTPDLIEGRIGEITEQLAGLEPEADAEQIEKLTTELGILEQALAPVTAAYGELTDAQGEVTEAKDAVAELADETSPEALEDALRSAANRNRDVTDEVVAWASQKLGVGDADGLIDDYAARR